MSGSPKAWPIRGLPFTARALLAPMEGVTDPLFRSLVLARNGPEQLGGATTEFVRVTDRPIGRRAMAAELAGAAFGRPVGLQLMGADHGAMAASAVAAVEAGAPFVDLNFGCPAKGALRGCAGSALLEHPSALEALVAAVARGLEGSGVPLTAKLRAGGSDDTQLEDLVRAATSGGAQLITLHVRTRAEGYRDMVDWGRLERAVAATDVPICGNGGIEEHADLERMLETTGCAFAMVGRAALADPWIFSGHRATAREAADFLEEYAARLGPGTGRGGSRLKQLLAYWTAGPGPGGLLGSSRREILRLADDRKVLAAIAERVRLAPIQSRADRRPLGRETRR